MSAAEAPSPVLPPEESATAPLPRGLDGSIDPTATTPAIEGDSTPEVEGVYDAGKIGIFGIKGAILRKLIDRHVRKSEAEDESSDAMQGMARSIIGGAGVAPKPEHHPVTRKERKAAYRQADDRVALMRARLRMKGTADWAGNSDQNGQPRYDKQADGKTKVVMGDGKIYVRTENQVIQNGTYVAPENAKGIITTRNATLPSDIGTQAQLDRLASGRYSKGHVRAEMQARGRYLADLAEEEALVRRMTARAEGNTQANDAARAKAAKHAGKAIKHDATLTGLEIAKANKRRRSSRRAA